MNNSSTICPAADIESPSPSTYPTTFTATTECASDLLQSAPLNSRAEHRGADYQSWLDLLETTEEDLPLDPEYLKTALFKCGLVVPIENFPKILKDPSHLSYFIDIASFRDQTAAYEDIIKEEEAGFMRPAVYIVSRSALFAVGCGWAFVEKYYPGENAFQKARVRKQRYHLGAGTGFCFYAFVLVPAIIAFLTGNFRGQLKMQIVHWLMYYNFQFAQPLMLAAATEHSSDILSLTLKTYFRYTSLRYEHFQVDNTNMPALEFLQAICSFKEISDTGRKIPRHFVNKANIETHRKSVLHDLENVNKADVYSHPLRQQLAYVSVGLYMSLVSYFPQWFGVHDEIESSGSVLRSVLKGVVAFALFWGTYGTFAMQMDATYQKFSKITRVATKFRFQTTKYTVICLENLDIGCGCTYFPTQSSSRGKGYEDISTFNLLDGNNLCLWWKSLEYLHDEALVETRYYYWLVNGMAFNTLNMIIALLYMSFFYQESYLRGFLAMSSLVLMHFVTVFVLLSLIVTLNNNMHFGTLDDLQRIAVYLKKNHIQEEAKHGRGPREVAEQIRRIENLVEVMKAKPLLVGRLFGHRITQALLNKISFSAAVALFSAVLRAGISPSDVT
jgi:hypothetical protein